MRNAMKLKWSRVNIAKIMVAFALISWAAGDSSARSRSLVEEIKSRFNKEKEVPRLIVLLSPT